MIHKPAYLKRYEQDLKLRSYAYANMMPIKSLVK